MSLTPAKKSQLIRNLADRDVVYVAGKWTRDDIELPIRTVATILMRAGGSYARLTVDEAIELCQEAVAGNSAQTRQVIRTGLPKSTPLMLQSDIIAPRAADNCIWHQAVKCYRDSNDQVVYILDVNDWNYVRVPVSSSGIPDFASALSATGVSEKLEDAWAKLISNASKRAAKAWNDAVDADPSAQPFAAVEEALLTGEGAIPHAAFRVLEAILEIAPFKYIDTESDTREEKDNYRILNFGLYAGKLLGRRVHAQYWQYLGAVCSIYKDRPFEMIPTPKTYANGEKAYTRVDIEMYKSDEPVQLGPAWTSWFQRFTPDDKEVHLAAIWASLDATNKSSQGIIINDFPGGSGKSHMFKALARLCGGDKVVCSLGKDAYGNQFAMSKVWDKRLVIFPDNRNPKLMKTEFIHHIQGGDAVDVEHKGRQSFTAELDLKVWIATNERMEIDSDNNHEARRSIIIEIDKTLLPPETQQVMSTGDGTFEDQLSHDREKAPLLINAYQAYKRLCPTNTYIVLPDSVRERLASYSSADNEMFHSISKTMFVRDDSAFLSWAEVQDTYMVLCKSAPQWQCAATTPVYGNFKAFLPKHWGVKALRKSDASRTRGITGVRLNSEAIAMYTDKRATSGAEGTFRAPQAPAPKSSIYDHR